ncbi:hypothetical protein, partial [Campylobacter subantarcticus]|uniref:hypothetical protein n=1 Tax=Campylobacter subantarcticus TaxID=497724 RepID=UPI0016592FCB
INANRFVTSTSSMSDADMKTFANLKDLSAGTSFSPVFNSQKAGNVVNMGNINANDVLLIGNKVDIQSGKIGKENSKTHLVGNDVYIDADNVKLNSTIDVTAMNGGHIQRQMNKFANDDYKFGENATINNVNYTETNGQIRNGNSSNFKKILTIGNMGDEKANATEWFYFAKGWNENQGETRSIDEFRLVGNIDFSGNQGQNKEGSQNYTNYCIDGLGCTSMIVGTDYYNNAFNKTFDGQGYTLKNINIDTTTLDNKPQYVGIFGNANGATFKNINVDYGGGIKAENNNGNLHVGGFIGESYNSTFTNISLNNIGDISSSSNDDYSYVGGFAGRDAYSTFENISLNNIGSVSSGADYYVYAGGFGGWTFYSIFSNISLNHIDSISGSSNGNYSFSHTGGFAGSASGDFSNISLNDIESISSKAIVDSYSGGFAGQAYSGKFINISLNNIGNIVSNNSHSSRAGGFVGSFAQTSPDSAVRVFFENISLNNINNISSSGGGSYTGGFAGWISNSVVGTFTNISLSDIDSISSGSNSNSGNSCAGGFAGYISGYGGLISGDIRFTNIYMYFKDDAKITASGDDRNRENKAGKFYGYKNNKEDTDIIFNNIHIYYKDNTLDNANASSGDEVNADSNNKTNKEINLHTYNGNDNKHNEFLDKAKHVTGASITPPTITPPSKPEQPDVSEGVSSDVKLDKDDLNIPVLNDILNDILNGKYSVSIDDLGNIKFTPTDKITLDSVKQSLDFLNEFFKQEGMEELLNKFESDLKNKYDKALALKDYLQTTIKSETQGIVNEFNAIKQAYEEELKKYNYYVNLLNEGKSIDNFDFTESAKKIKEYKNQLDGYISDINDKIATKYNQEIKEQFKYTDFTIKNDLFYSNMQIPNQPSIPDTGSSSLSFEQTSSFNLKGDEAIKEE